MIFYFSGTGNTRWAAEAIGNAIGEQTIDMAHEPEGNGHYALGEGERIGFCFPVHGWRPPQLVRQFVQRLRIGGSEGHYCWALCTAGDDIGMAMEYLNGDLLAAGLQAESVFSLIMPESYVGLPFMDVDSPAKEWDKKVRAGRELDRAIEDIAAHRRGIIRTYKGHWPRINSRVLGAVFSRWLVTDKPFRVRPEACTACGTCARVCPVADIEGGAGSQPRWKHNGRCLTCFSCYHHCPVHAIEYGRRTKDKGQYFYR